RRNRVALTGAVLLMILYALTAFAGFFSPYSPTNDEFRSHFYHPPTKIHFRDPEGDFHLRPFVFRTYLADMRRLLYTESKPLRIHHKNSAANANPYLPDLWESTEPILTVRNDRGEMLAQVHEMQETAENSNWFAALVPMIPDRISETHHLVVTSTPGHSAEIPVLDRSRPALQDPFSEVFDVQDEEGKHLLGYDPRVERYPLFFFVTGAEYRIFGFIPWNRHLFGVKSPAHLFLFGSDQWGRDIFSRVLYGAQISLTIGLVGVLITTLFGLLLGGIAGYYGGTIDNLIMRFAEVLLSIPALYLILTLRNIIPDTLQQSYDKVEESVNQTFAWQQNPLLFGAVSGGALLSIAYYNYSKRWRLVPLIATGLLFVFVVFGAKISTASLKLLQLILPGTIHLSSQWT
ncbi:MAG TPA: hypothetical protein VJ521_15275, partial [Acidobacteriota bacterium]|nr:hypothetical protein [Acidobacteriota bacterium]